MLSSIGPTRCVHSPSDCLVAIDGALIHINILHIVRDLE